MFKRGNMTKASIQANQVRFFSGSSNPELAANIAKELEAPLDRTHITRAAECTMMLKISSFDFYDCVRRIGLVWSVRCNARNPSTAIIPIMPQAYQSKFGS